jgi:hypothetical protein
MKKYYFFLLILSVAAHSQSFQWLVVPDMNLNLNPGLVGYCTAADNSGNIYMTGFQDHPYSYGDIFGDVFFNKYNEEGALQFSKTFTGRVAIYDVATDGAGNVLMSIGYVNDAVIGTLTLSTVNQGIQPLLVKFDTNGNLVWHFIPVIPGSFEPYFRAVTADASGNVYIGYDDFQHSYIQKLSPDGAPQLTITQLNAKLISSIDTDTEGNIYVAGSCAENNASYAGVTVPTSFTYNTWVVKYSPQGVYQWMHYVDDVTCSQPEVKANTPDEVYFSSLLYGPYAFGSITAEGPENGFSGDFFLARLNASGEFQWVREIPAGSTGTVDSGNRNYLDVDSQGNVIFAGSTRNTIAWNNDIITTGQGFSSDGILLKYDSEGSMLMAKVFGGASEDRVDGVAFNVLGDIIVSGMARGNASFDNLSHEEDGVTIYPYLAKITSIILGNDNPRLIPVRLWPNPVSTTIHLSNIIDKTTGEIHNVLGQKIMSVEISQNAAIDVSRLSDGLYFLTVSGYPSVKFIKE